MANSHVTLPPRKLIYTLCIRHVEHTRFNLRRSRVLEVCSRMLIGVFPATQKHLGFPRKPNTRTIRNTPRGFGEFYISFNYTNANANESVRVSS